jgi:hypothetical protein
VTRVAAACRNCGASCEWDRDDVTGAVIPAYPCDARPGSACAPPDPVSRLAVEMSRDFQRAASRRARGFVGRGKKR